MNRGSVIQRRALSARAAGICTRCRERPVATSNGPFCRPCGREYFRARREGLRARTAHEAQAAKLAARRNRIRRGPVPEDEWLRELCEHVFSPEDRARLRELLPAGVRAKLGARAGR